MTKTTETFEDKCERIAGYKNAEMFIPELLKEKQMIDKLETTLYAVCLDYGCEGFRHPSAIFDNAELARLFVAGGNLSSGTQYKIFSYAMNKPLRWDEKNAVSLVEKHNHD